MCEHNGELSRKDAEAVARAQVFDLELPAFLDRRPATSERAAGDDVGDDDIPF